VVDFSLQVANVTRQSHRRVISLIEWRSHRPASPARRLVQDRTAEGRYTGGVDGF
jgi:hypothetical protein